jgi:cell wall-associated NlpC family hydrolase
MGFATMANNPDNYSSQKIAKGYNGLRDIEAGSAKCNVFVGDTYAVGGEIGYGDGRYPIRRPAVKFWLPATPLSANDLQNPANRINKFPITSNPKIGDIISFPPHGNEDDGHTGIYLGYGLYMSARAGVHPGSGVQTENGVMISRIPYNDYPGQIVYRTYKPHDSTFTHGR